MSVTMFPDASQELIDAITDTVGQRDGQWLNARAGRTFKWLVLWRSRALDTFAARGVRLAVALNAADSKGYHYAMYARLRVLGAGTFRSMLLDAARAGRLVGIAEVSEKDLIFHTPRLAFDGHPYAIRYSQMRMAVVFLAFLHHTIGPPVVDETLDAMDDSLGAADRACRHLLKQLDAWLDDHLADEYRLRQAIAVGRHLNRLETAKAWFDRQILPSGEVETISMELDGWVTAETLVDSRHKERWPLGYRRFRQTGRRTFADEPYMGRPIDLIDDEAILSFWEHVNLAPNSDAGQIGARRFRSAARLVLDYRLALDRAATWDALEKATRLVRTDGGNIDVHDARTGLGATLSAFRNGTGDHGTDEEDNDVIPHDDGGAEDDVTISGTIFRAVDGDAEMWTSPLTGLTGGNGDPVKWLTASDMDVLGKIMDAGSGVPALFGKGKPNGTFARTLLRALHFGALQEAAIARGWQPTVAHSNPYVEMQTFIEALSAKIENLAYATAYALILRGSKPKALALLLQLEPNLRARTLGERPPLMSADRLFDKMVEKLLEPSNELGRRMKTGYRATNRAGFRAVDEADEAYTSYLEQGGELVPALFQEVSAIASGLKRVDSLGAYPVDARRFEGALAVLYGPGAPLEPVEVNHQSN